MPSPFVAEIPLLEFRSPFHPSQSAAPVQVAGICLPSFHFVQSSIFDPIAFFLPCLTACRAAFTCANAAALPAAAFPSNGAPIAISFQAISCYINWQESSQKAQSFDLSASFSPSDAWAHDLAISSFQCVVSRYLSRTPTPAQMPVKCMFSKGVFFTSSLQRERRVDVGRRSCCKTSMFFSSCPSPRRIVPQRR
jgi:hypothetical protein